MKTSRVTGAPPMVLCQVVFFFFCWLCNHVLSKHFMTDSLWTHPTYPLISWSMYFAECIHVFLKKVQLKSVKHRTEKEKLKVKSWRILCWGQNKTLYSQHAHNVLTVFPKINYTPVWCVIEITELTVYHYIPMCPHWFVLVLTSVDFEAKKCLAENWNFTSLLLTLWIANGFM